MKDYPFPHTLNKLDRGAIQIAGIYLLVGVLWILFSDQIAARVALNPEMLALISLYKGWGYVIVTALLLYWLVRRHTSALRASEEQLHQVVDAMPVFISYVGADRNYRFTNKTYEEWFDEKPDGRHVEDVLGKAAYEIVSKHIDKVLNGEIVSFEAELPFRGQDRFFHVRYIPDIQANGKVKGFFVLSSDQTEQRQTAEERRLWGDAFEGCAHGIAVGDPHSNRILVCNPAFASLHKSRVEDIIGLSISSLYAPPDQELVRRNIQKADQIGHSRFEALMIRRDASTFPVQMDMVSVLGEDGELLYRVVTAQDISERKAVEKVLQESEERYRIVSEITSDYAYSDRVEADGSIVPEWITDSFTRITGYTLEDAKAPEFWRELIHPNDLPILLQHMQTVLAGQADTREMRVIAKDGEVRSLRDIANPVWDSSQERVVGLYGAVQDVTEYKRAQEQIMYQARLLEQVNDAVIATDERFVITAWNPAAKHIYGWEAAEVIGVQVEQILKTEFLNTSHLEALHQVKETGRFSAEVVQSRKNGSKVHIEAHTVTLHDEHGNIAGYVSANRDITERKQAEENLRRFELLSEHSRDIILFMGFQDGRILEANAAATQAYGYSRDELLTLTIQDLRASATRNLTAEQMAQADTAGILFETVHRCRDGSTFPVEVSSQGATISGVRTLISIVRDITGRKQAEDAIRLKDQLLHLTSQMAKVGGWEFDPESGKGTWTDEVARIHDLDPAQETNIEMGFSFYPGESRQKVERAVKEAIELAKPYDLELEMVTATGNHKWVRTIALPIVRDGKVAKVQGIFQDITQRKQIEKALQVAHAELEIKVQERTAALSEANALLQALMDHMPDHIYFKDRQSRFIRNSRSQAKLLGLNDPAEAVGKTDFDFFPHAAKSYADEQEIMRAGSPRIDFEEWVVWPDGREMWVSTTKVPLRNDGGQTIGIFGISHDITERKRAEQAIRQLNSNLEKQAEKLQAANKELEAFSYSVSHDLRAPLRAIDGYTRILVEDYEANLDAEGKRICSVISTEARRMGQLIDDLLAFSRLGRKEMFTSKIDMKALAGSVFDELVNEQARERLDFRIAKLPSTRGDLSLMHQVWSNLLSNAIKFTSKKEQAAIEVGSKQTWDENIYYVRDNGAGFDMEYAGKLFGVFQRLHGESEFEGTGVGLAIVQRIVRRHGGRVWAEGEVEKGATIYFALPRKENHHE